MNLNFDTVLDMIDEAVTGIEQEDHVEGIEESMEILKSSLKTLKPIKCCLDLTNMLYKNASVVSKTHANIMQEYHLSLLSGQEVDAEHNLGLEGELKKFKFNHQLVEAFTLQYLPLNNLALMRTQTADALNYIVYFWLLAHECFQAASQFAACCQITLDSRQSLYLDKLSDLVAVISKTQGADSVFAYVLDNYSFFKSVDSNLCFNIHKHKIIRMIKSSNYLEAYLYYTKNLGDYKEYTAEIEELMGYLIFKMNDINKIELDYLWPCKFETFETFCMSNSAVLTMATRDLSTLMGAPCINALDICVEAGFGVLKNYAESLEYLVQVDDSQRLEVEFSKVQTHVTFSTGAPLQFHSLWICPISKEHCHLHNPPVLLVCGHVISSESMRSLSNSIIRNKKFKCPYCPVNMRPDACKVVKI